MLLQLLDLLYRCDNEPTVRFEREDLFPEDVDIPGFWKGQNRDLTEQQLLVAFRSGVGRNLARKRGRIERFVCGVQIQSRDLPQERQRYCD